MTGGASSIRAFLALELASELHERLAELMSDLRPRVAGVRWVRPEGIHLTLRFLGAAAPEQLQSLGDALVDAARGCPAAVAVVRGLGVFPERGQPRVLWVGLEIPPEVYSLQAACERAARQAGFEREGRPFQPHLTLGRWRDRAARPALPATDLGAAPLSVLTLFRSDLRPGGAVYTPLRRLSLGR